MDRISSFLTDAAAWKPANESIFDRIRNRKVKTNAKDSWPKFPSVRAMLTEGKSTGIVGGIPVYLNDEDEKHLPLLDDTAHWPEKSLSAYIGMTGSIQKQMALSMWEIYKDSSHPKHPILFEKGTEYGSYRDIERDLTLSMLWIDPAPATPDRPFPIPEWIFYFEDTSHLLGIEPIDSRTGKLYPNRADAFAITCDG